VAELVVVGFDSPTDADRVLTELTRLQKEYLIDLEDAAVAIRSSDGSVGIKPSVNLVSLGAASGGLGGALWGSLIGLLFLNPLAGFALGGAVGAGSGALSGNMLDYGINDDFRSAWPGRRRPRPNPAGKAAGPHAPGVAPLHRGPVSNGGRDPVRDLSGCWVVGSGPHVAAAGSGCPAAGSAAGGVGRSQRRAVRTRRDRCACAWA
jgi:hypothetical protein